MSFRPAVVDCDVMAVGVTSFPQAFCEGGDKQTEIFWRRLMKEAHNGFRHPLRARRERPRGRRPTEQRDELAAFEFCAHSITSSAATWRVSGIVSPSALAVLRFIMSSNLVGCMTGKSAGFSPLRIRPV